MLQRDGEERWFKVMRIPLQTRDPLVQQGSWTAPLRHREVAVHSDEIVPCFDQELFAIFADIVDLCVVLRDVSMRIIGTPESPWTNAADSNAKPVCTRQRFPKRVHTQPDGRAEGHWSPSTNANTRCRVRAPFFANAARSSAMVTARVCWFVAGRLANQTPLHGKLQHHFTHSCYRARRVGEQVELVKESLKDEG